MLFREQCGFKITPDDVVETLISTSRALQVAAKYMILKSIVKSQHIIGKTVIEDITGSVMLPNIKTLTEKSLQELRNLTIKKV